MAEAGDVAEEVTGAEEAWVVEAGAAEAGVAEAGATEALSVEAGAGLGSPRLGPPRLGPSTLCPSRLGWWVAFLVMVTGVVAHTVIGGATAGAVFPSWLRIWRAGRDLWVRRLGWRLVNTEICTPSSRRGRISFL